MLNGTPLRIVNVDHHHDNTRFGAIDHVVDAASCTAEIVWDLMRGLGVEPTPEIADALYVGLVTDTGKFMYENTGTRAHVMAAELIAAGVDVHGIYRRLYEGMPFAKLELLARALRNVRRFDDGAADAEPPDASTTSRESGAEESYSEGIIDHLRARRRARRSPRSCASCSTRPRPAARRSRCAAPTATVDVSASSPAPAAAAATARPPASPPS